MTVAAATARAAAAPCTCSPRSRCSKPAADRAHASRLRPGARKRHRTPPRAEAICLEGGRPPRRPRDQESAHAHLALRRADPPPHRPPRRHARQRCRSSRPPSPSSAAPARSSPPRSRACARWSTSSPRSPSFPPRSRAPPTSTPSSRTPSPSSPAACRTSAWSQRLAPDLPLVLADPEAMKRALGNLIDNAAEAMQQSPPARAPHLPPRCCPAAWSSSPSPTPAPASPTRCASASSCPTSPPSSAAPASASPSPQRSSRSTRAPSAPRRTSPPARSSSSNCRRAATDSNPIGHAEARPADAQPRR